eukprot:gene24686-biopygen11931
MRRRRRRTGGAKEENMQKCGAAGAVQDKREGNTQLLALYTFHYVHIQFCHVIITCLVWFVGLVWTQLERLESSFQLIWSGLIWFVHLVLDLVRLGSARCIFFH